MKPKKVLMIGLGLCLALLAGLFWLRSPKESTRHAVVAMPQSSPVSAVKEEATSVVTPTVTFTPLLSHQRPESASLTFDRMLSESGVFFTAQERAVLKSLFQASLRERRTLEASRAVVDHAPVGYPPGQILIKIPSYEQEGLSLAARFHEGVQAVVGKDRGEAFFQANDQRLTMINHGWGAHEQFITVSYDADREVYKVAHKTYTPAPGALPPGTNLEWFFSMDYVGVNSQRPEGYEALLPLFPPTS